MSLTLERLRAVLHYDPDAGEFTWRKSTGRAAAGASAGCVAPDSGYVIIGLDRERYLAHRLAWFYVTSAFPAEDIDHRDGVRANNKWRNLRTIPRRGNLQNLAKRSGKTSRYLGVNWDATRGQWLARIKVAGVAKNLGRFSTEEEAYAAYRRAKIEQHPHQPVPREILEAFA